MPQANLATIQRLYEVWNREGGPLSGLPMFASDCEYVYPETAIEPGTHQGHAGIAKALEAVDAAFGRYVHEPQQMIEAGDDKILAYVVFRATGRDSGAPVEIAEQHVWTLRDGEIVRFQWFHDEPAARRAAGL
jgi:ketosteroid isomerase-like protein